MMNTATNGSHFLHVIGQGYSRRSYTRDMTSPDVLRHWRESLQQWAIPQHIIDAAPESPWIHPVESFVPRGNLHVDVPSRTRALERLDGASPSVLDVGCGGGRAAFGLVPPAVRVVGVDHQQGMLDVFARQAAERGVACGTVLGDWPEASGRTPVCDVVVCHHVLYNVQELEPFVNALSAHATRRVVVELPGHHPLSNMSAAWSHFWSLERPESPTAADALECVRSLGHDASIEWFADPPREHQPPTDDEVRHTRIRLCLPATRDDDIREFLRANPRGPRQLATIWWDV